MNTKLKFLSALGLLLIMSIMLAACAPAVSTPVTTTATTAAATTPESTTTQPAERVAVRIAALKGPTGIGLVGLMDSQEAGTTQNDYTFSLSGAPDDITAKLISGQADIAALPTNLAAVLYQKTNQEVLMLAVNTLGVIYILEKGNTVQSLSDLAGKTILASGQGAVPEYVLNDLLQKGNLTQPATVEYKSEHSELATLALSGQADLVMLPEPFVTTVLSKNSEFRIALDLTEEWNKVQTAAGNNSGLSMGCLVVTASFASAHPDALAMFLDEYARSVDFVNSDTTKAGERVAAYGILADAGLAAKAIPTCNIVLVEGEAMKDSLKPFFEILFAANPKSVGGKLPDDNFYWMRSVK
ncbi:MAG TPA: sulfonate/nitrate/taurine transporter substrate-binding protein [Clostridiales bacterium]|nr:sulfonate/nitrate/taurine transporter substrate-binding protein [Clostridiales bacterium]